jgi:hypothetical protein
LLLDLLESPSSLSQMLRISNLCHPVGLIIAPQDISTFPDWP